jgi:S1-C subfamily serine protease
MQFNHVLAALLSCTNIVLLVQGKAFANPSSPAVAFSVNELRKTAQETTVFISSEEENGSGLIIARKAKSYYVLTSAHVLKTNNNYQITTPDRRQYEASIVARRLPGLDLAILEFKSQQSYRVATLANYGQANKGLIDVGNVYVSGWDGSNSSTHPVFSCGIKFQGDMPSLMFIRKDPISDGYELAYTNITQPGLSGGPIFDVQGRVIGVHGQAEGSNFESLGSIKLGFRRVIRILCKGLKIKTQKEINDYGTTEERDQSIGSNAG